MEDLLPVRRAVDTFVLMVFSVLFDIAVVLLKRSKRAEEGAGDA